MSARRTALAGSLAVILGLALAARADEPVPPAAAAQRRYEQVSEQIGSTCRLDAECPSPLRCAESLCAAPRGMVGGADVETPAIVFYGGGDEVAYYLEVVDDPAERGRGLMHRPSMLTDWGMLFVYPDERPLAFWMQNTFIPLDMVFLDAGMVVVGVVENAEPLTTTSRAVPGESQFVVELNAGQSAAHGIVAGVRAELLNVPADLVSSSVSD